MEKEPKLFSEKEMISFGQWCINKSVRQLEITETHVDEWIYQDLTKGIELETDYPVIKSEEPATVFWQCLGGCGKDTSDTKWLGCCSQECMKSWLETHPSNPISFCGLCGGTGYIKGGPTDSRKDSPCICAAGKI